MHMSDALLSPIVGGGMYLASTGVMGYSIRKIKLDALEHRIPLMGVMGAFLFAAQMVNFSIPGTGSSGHIGGGMLLSIILGPSAGFLTLACVLLIQALFFADGGLIALGCNLINLGFFTCFVAYPLIYSKIVLKHKNKTTIFIGAVVASIIGLQLGSLGVVAQTFLSGRTELSLGTFLLFMQPIHLAIGLIEGIITATIVVYLVQQNASILYDAQTIPSKENKKPRTVLGITGGLLIAALLVGGIVSLVASSNPDGLEWAIEKTAQGELSTSNSAMIQWLAQLQERASFLPDYSFKNSVDEQSGLLGTSVSGIVGSLITLGVTLLLAWLIRKNTGKKVIQEER
jgi:cobalt/nickel transport system permease protein